MKALIWSAGFGTRLLPLTEILPKPLFPICNIPMIDIIISYLKSRGVSSFGINTHYLRAPLVSHLKAMKEDIFITEEEEILGTGGGTVSFKKFLKDEEFFIVHTSDILTTLNLADAIKFHREHRNMVTLVLVDYKPINHVSILEDGTIVDIANMLGRKFDPSVRNLAGTAIVIYSNEFLSYLPDEKRYFEINPYILEIIKKYPGKVMGYIPENFYWRDIGTKESYWEAHRDILVDNICPLIDKTVTIHPSAKIDSNVIMDGFVVVGKNVRLRGNMVIKNSIIWDNLDIYGSMEIKNSIITEKHSVRI